MPHRQHARASSFSSIARRVRCRLRASRRSGSDALPDVPDAKIRVGIGYIFSYLQARDDASLLASLRSVLQWAQETDTPVLIQIDGEQWWEGRPDLWNWWDPSRPGFDPANRENVEWSGLDAGARAEDRLAELGKATAGAPAAQFDEPPLSPGVPREDGLADSRGAGLVEGSAGGEKGSARRRSKWAGSRPSASMPGTTRTATPCSIDPPAKTRLPA